MTTQPDWSQAPEWAQWVAMERDGEWNWYECEPTMSDEGQWQHAEGKATRVHLRPACHPRPTKETD